MGLLLCVTAPFAVYTSSCGKRNKLDGFSVKTIQEGKTLLLY